MQSTESTFFSLKTKKVVNQNQATTPPEASSLFKEWIFRHTSFCKGLKINRRSLKEWIFCTPSHVDGTQLAQGMTITGGWVHGAVMERTTITQGFAGDAKKGWSMLPLADPTFVW